MTGQEEQKDGRPSLWLLTGCTACGKTEVSLQCAEHVDAEIVSCDALLFYRGMDIGTAKPTPAELARVPHHLIDILGPLERMDVKRYVQLARAVVQDVLARRRRVLVVGGSGFYLKSYLAPVADDVPVDLALRGELERDLEKAGLESLLDRLRALNPSGIDALDTRNPRRVLRALERCLASGRTLVELGEAFRAQASPFSEYDVRVVEIARDAADLRKRIHARAAAMVTVGLVEEVRALQAAGFEANPAVASAVGYRETLAWIRHGGTRDELVDAIARATNRLARKQRTWFRGQLPPHRVLKAGEGLEGSRLAQAFLDPSPAG